MLAERLLTVTNGRFQRVDAVVLLLKRGPEFDDTLSEEPVFLGQVRLRPLSRRCCRVVALDVVFGL